MVRRLGVPAADYGEYSAFSFLRGGHALRLIFGEDVRLCVVCLVAWCEGEFRRFYSLVRFVIVRLGEFVPGVYRVNFVGRDYNEFRLAVFHVFRGLVC